LPNIAISKEKLNQVFNISAEGSQDAVEHTLSVRLGKHHFGFAISNQHTNELLQLSWYVLDETGRHELDEVYMKHPELRNSFERVMVGYDHPRSILVPHGSCTENDPGLMLEAMYGGNGTHTIITESIPGWQLQNIYAVPGQIQDWLIRHFPSAHYRHNYSVGIKQINSTDSEDSLLVDFRSNDFTLVASKAGNLLLVQTFSYATPTDVIYYLVKVCQELAFTQETVTLALSGLIEEESNLYTELNKYFLHIRFRDSSWQIQAGREQAYPAHFFTSLNDLALCAS
jgi:Protein of unknown function (DUF3822)